jgi:hypothetical protein
MLHIRFQKLNRKIKITLKILLSCNRITKYVFKKEEELENQQIQQEKRPLPLLWYKVDEMKWFITR